MPNTFFGLTIGKSGLYSYQAAINTAAHNSANAQTQGYSRQQTLRSASAAISIVGSYGMAGTGVDVNGVVQVRDQYYDVKYWNNNAVYGNYSTKQYYLSNIENYLSEIKSDGTTAVFDKIFTAMTGLATSPGDTNMRTQVAEFGQTFAEYMNFLYTGLQKLQDECNFEIKNAVDKINSLAKEITNLTKQINTIEVRGGKANDLRDARALLVDKLSEIANVTVTEQSAGDGIGVNQYIVRLDGKTLVDTYEYNTLKVIPQEAGVNKNDMDGLYYIKWNNGQNFDANSTSLSGTLKALLEVRDGNNKQNFTGTAKGTAGTNTLTITNSNITDFNLLNIPDANGRIKVGAREYVYEKFTVEKVADGTVTYTFTLKETLAEEIKDTAARIGESIEYKGIPYYMGQFNEFVRTFATAFNDIHKTGQDFYGNKNELDFFTSKNPTTGEDMKFAPVRDGNGNLVYPQKIDSSVQNSYYHMNIGNFKVSGEILADPKKIACAEDRVSNGIEDAGVLNKLIALKTDVTMFKQGRPDSFLQTLVGVMGIDAKAAKNLSESQDNIVKAIESQRMSVSGVDVDEETMDLVKFKNAYDLNSKVISVMNQIYNKLINETGI